MIEFKEGDYVITVRNRRLYDDKGYDDKGNVLVGIVGPQRKECNEGERGCYKVRVKVGNDIDCWRKADIKKITEKEAVLYAL